MTHRDQPDAWQARLGEHLRAARLRLNVDQRTVARRAQIALNAVKHLESGHGATVGSLISVLRVLGRTDWIDALATPVEPSRKGQRLRASRRPQAQANYDA
jgi:transcriptional regulator with XRE-family HTH domain